MVKAQICRSYIPDIHPNSRYTDHKNGTVTDNETKLMWRKCVQGYSGDQCSIGSGSTGNGIKLDWKEALDYAGSQDFAGYTDWRLPNVKELESLVIQNCYEPAINEALFPNTLESGLYFWTSSPQVERGYAWYVNFSKGHTAPYNRGFFRRMRFVRAGGL
jgi:hypothetical protein